MSAVHLRVDGLVIGKGRPRFSRKTGTAYTPERTVSYENLVAWHAQGVMKGRPLIVGPVRVEISIYVQIPVSKTKKFKTAAASGALWPTGTPDIDNAVKGIFDAINKVVWLDDSQVVSLCATKSYSDRPRFEMTIVEIGD